MKVKGRSLPNFVELEVMVGDLSLRRGGGGGCCRNGFLEARKRDDSLGDSRASKLVKSGCGLEATGL